MKKYRASNGWAVNPDKDMRMLEEMSTKGWHLTGMRGIWYVLEKGEAHSYIYNLNMEKNTTSDMLSIFKNSGWTLIFAAEGCQIFRAESGTTPIFTDNESKLEALIPVYKFYRKASCITIPCLIVSFILTIMFCTNVYLFPFLTLTTLILAIASSYSFVPFIGLKRMISKCQ